MSAEADTIDSLKNLLPGSQGAYRVEILKALGYAYIIIDNNNIQAKKYGYEAYKIANSISDSSLIVKTGVLLASSLRRTEAIDSAIQVYKSIELIARKKNLTDDLKVLLNSLGLSYALTAQYDKAIPVLFETLELRKKSNRKDEVEIAHTNIGFVYYKLKAYDNAIIYYQKALQSAIEREVYSEQAKLYINIATVYAYSNNQSLARQNIHSAIQACNMDCVPVTMALIAFCQGVIEFHANNLDLAEQHFLNGYNLSKEIKDTRLQLDNLEYLAKIYLHESRLDLVTMYTRKAEALLKINPAFNLEAIKSYKQFAEVCQLAGDFKKASHYQQRYIALKDSIYNEKLTSSLVEFETELQHRENNMKITSQNELLQMNEKTIRYQDYTNKAIALLVVVLFLFAVVLSKTIVTRKRVGVLLQQKVRERTSAQEHEHRELLERYSMQNEVLLKAVEEASTYAKQIKTISQGLPVQEGIGQEYFMKIDDISSALSKDLDDLKHSFK